jgi:hypothetical protein
VPPPKPDIDSGSLLLSGPKQEGGHVGNGYVGAWIKSLVGSQGPVQSGYEHVQCAHAQWHSDFPPILDRRADSNKSIVYRSRLTRPAERG